ncbi:dihydroorotase family protein [Pleomorphomonas sp. PLEO]|uniref:dihydroorotase n=1 Tax=Pleomorphomonas sp. PLEO TaxID=3239306 RepID=UPI00351EB07F
MFDLVVAGRLVTPAGLIDAGWIAVSGGSIAAIGCGERPSAADVIDYGDAFVLPGIVDGQTHAGSQIGFAGMAPTTRAAVIGGVTTIVDMPYDHPTPVTTAAVLAEKVAAIDRLAVCDVALYGTVPREPDLGDVRDLMAGGVAAFKISSFEAHPDRFPRIGNAAALVLLDALATSDLPLGLHNEDQEIVAATTTRFKAAGLVGPEFHAPSRPPVAELAATATFMELGAASGGHAHIVHISLADGFELVTDYRVRGHRATAEMCVHYLTFDAEVDMQRWGGRLKVNPPIRAGERERLWQVLEDGGVAFVSSDHSAWPLARKDVTSIFDAAAGMPGLETLLPAFFTAAAARKGVEAAAELTADYLCDRPARFFGLSRKGRLAPGFDADLTVLKPGDHVFDASTAPEGAGWSCYDGATFTGMPTATYVRGRRVWDGKQVAADAVGHGRFVRRG